MIISINILLSPVHTGDYIQSPKSATVAVFGDYSRRIRRLSLKTATVAEIGDSRRFGRVAVFRDSCRIATVDRTLLFDCYVRYCYIFKAAGLLKTKATLHCVHKYSHRLGVWAIQHFDDWLRSGEIKSTRGAQWLVGFCPISPNLISPNPIS